MINNLFYLYFIVMIMALVNLVQKRRIYTKIIISILFILTAFRDVYASADTNSYFLILESLKNGGDRMSSFTHLFHLIAVFSVNFKNSITIFNTINAVIFYSLVYVYIFRYKREQHHTIMYVMVFFQILVLGFAMVRQVPAIMLFLISLEYLKNNKLKQYYFLNLIGCLFHYVAVVQLLGHIIYKIIINRELRIIAFVFPITLLIIWPIIGIATKTIPGLAHYNNYFVLEFNTQTSILSFILRISIALGFNFCLRRYIENKRLQVYSIMLLIGLIISSGTFLNKEFSRIGLPYVLAFIPLFSEILIKFNVIELVIFGRVIYLKKSVVFVVVTCGLMLMTIMYNIKIFGL